MNCLTIAFIKICDFADLKTQKTTFLNPKQCGAFFEMHNFKRLTCDFTKRLTVFLKITFLNRTF